jgi:hypothetical protein
MLVERGFMARNELQYILRSAMVDALLALTTPQAGGSSVSDIRFEAPGVHWAAAFVRLPLESVQAEVARRAEQMSHAGVADTVTIALADFDRGPAILTRDQWAIACRVNGSLTARDLARQAGLPLYDTITALGILLRRGLCTLATPSEPGAHTATPVPHGGNLATPAPRRGDLATPAPRADGPAAQPAGAGRAPARPSRESTPGPAGPAPRDVPVLNGTQLPPAPRDPNPRISVATPDLATIPGPAPTAGPAGARTPTPGRPSAGSGQDSGAFLASVTAPGSADILRRTPDGTGYRPDPEPSASPSSSASLAPSAQPISSAQSDPSARSAPSEPPRGVPSSQNVPPPPSPRYPGDVPPAIGAEKPRHTPSPSWVPSADELLSQHGTAPQTNLAAPRDVPLWAEARPLRDPGSSRPARAGLARGAHRGPAGSPMPGPAEPLAAQSGPATIPADLDVPPARRRPSFTPIVPAASLTSPELAGSQAPVPSPLAEGPVPAAAAPTATVPPAPTDVPPAPADVPLASADVPPAPTDVPLASTDVPLVRPSRRLPPAHPGYRRPPRPAWSTAAPPVPSAVLAAPAAVDSGAAARPPGPGDPDSGWRPLLPQREPGAGLVQPPRNATAPMPVRNWPSPEPGQAAEPEPEPFASTGPDLLRRVLDGLRRLA